MISFRDLILHNFWLKLFSIALATVIWLAIYKSIHNENKALISEYIRVPVTVITAPGDKRAFRVTPEEVVVVAVGKDDALLRATRKDIRVNLDLTGFHARSATLQQLQAQAPPDIKVLGLEPSSVDVEQVSP